MLEDDSISEKEMEKLAREMIASRARARQRSAKAATKKRQVGLTRITLWVPAKWAQLIRPSVEEIIAEFEQAELEGQAQVESEQISQNS